MAATKRNSLIVAAIFLIHHLTLWQRAHGRGRACHDERQQMHPPAARRAAVPVG